MTKAKEIEILTEAANRLGPDSYLGPWLKERMAELEGLLRSDIMPDLSLNDAMRRAQGIRDAAKAEAESIVAAANKVAADIRKDVDRYTAAARTSLHETARQLDKLASNI